MDQDFQVKIIDSQLRELYGRVVWTHKTQEKCADILLLRHSRLKIVQIILSALTTTGILVSVFGEIPSIGAVSAGISALLFGLNTYTKDYDLGEIAQKHAHAATELWNIREGYLSLITDIKTKSLTYEQIINKRDELQEALYQTYKGSPRTINSAYKKATKGLKQNQEMTFTNKELNEMLPIELRIY